MNGEDVTANLRTVGRLGANRGIPERLAGDAPRRVEVRGEVLLFKEHFEAMNRQILRPAASRSRTRGTPRRVRCASSIWRVTATRPLSFIAYEALVPGREAHARGAWRTHCGEARGPRAHFGFETNPENARCAGIAEVKAYRDAMAERRFALPYDTDGVVVKVDDLDWQRRLGAASKFPRWAVAFKYPPQEEATQRPADLGVGRAHRDPHAGRGRRARSGSPARWCRARRSTTRTRCGARTSSWATGSSSAARARSSPRS